jgi:aspartyl-tRNA(Asn)/glutamyl-tRNA(Gln) amidotransferase subunit C
MTEKKILSQKDVEKVAQLARIELSEVQQEKFAEELSSILDYFKDLSNADTSRAVTFDHYSLMENQFREDGVSESKEDEKEGVRTLFPQREGNSLKVKTVLDHK